MMEFPKTIKSALERYPMVNPPSIAYSYEHACEGARHHSPMPLVVHLVTISDKAREVWLCPTCRDNLKVLRHFIVEHNGDVPWVLRREFGNILRALAFEDWGTQEDVTEEATDA